MNKLKVGLCALLIVGFAGIGYIGYLAKARSDCEGLLTQELSLNNFVSAIMPERYDEIVGPVSKKRAQVCLAMYEKFGVLWPEEDPFSVGR